MSLRNVLIGALASIRTYADRISYLHLKSAQDGQPMPYLVGNPLAFETIYNDSMRN